MPNWLLLVIITVAVILLVVLLVTTWPIGPIIFLVLGLLLALAALVASYFGVDVQSYLDKVVNLAKDAFKVIKDFKALGF